MTDAVFIKRDTSSDSLAHYGRLGMKWGQHIYSSARSKSRKWSNTKLNNALNVHEIGSRSSAGTARTGVMNSLMLAGGAAGLIALNGGITVAAIPMATTAVASSVAAAFTYKSGAKQYYQARAYQAELDARERKGKIK